MAGTEAGIDRRSAARNWAARSWAAGHPGALVASGYLAAAVALNWRLWLGFGTMSAVGDPGPADNDLMAWFMRYAADAVAHGHLPALVSTALNAPHGFPLMWNNSVLFPAVALAPVTLLAGPLASLTVLVTLGYAGSAAAMYWLLRRYGASVLAAGLGGAVFGFSPGMLNAGMDHYGMQFAALTPLMIEAVLSIVTRRGSPLAAGAWLGLLAAAQLFTGEEMLVGVAIASLVLAAVLAASRPSAVRARLGGASAGLATGAAVALLLCSYGLWTQFHGPLAEHGTPWHIANHGNSLGAFVNPQAQLVFHSAASAAYADGHRASTAEYLAYLGPPLLILVVAVTVWYWRDLRVRSAGVTWAVLEALSLGVNGPLLPFHWLQGLPLFGDMFPSRLSILADGAAAAVLAFGLDLARSAAPRTAGPLRRAVPVLVALLAVLPLLPRPAAAIPGARVPAGWDTVFAGLAVPPDAGVLVVPLPYSQQGEAMLWQADTGQPAELVAGWFLGPNQSGNADDGYWGPAFTARTVRCLGTLWQSTSSPSDTSPSDTASSDTAAPGTATQGGSCAAAFRSALGYWHPAAVVADTGQETPLGRFLIGVLGQPPVRDGQLLAWRTAFAENGTANR
ncbi:MAG TPA: hypothetical protein VF223_11500 [Trebonia sp.]